MGQVWQVTDTQLNREVALKILPDAFAADPDRLARFKREAQILASLNHPNIAAIYGIEEAEGTRALVLELGRAAEGHTASAGRFPARLPGEEPQEPRASDRRCPAGAGGSVHACRWFGHDARRVAWRPVAAYHCGGCGRVRGWGDGGDVRPRQHGSVRPSASDTRRPHAVVHCAARQPTGRSGRGTHTRRFPHRVLRRGGRTVPVVRASVERAPGHAAADGPRRPTPHTLRLSRWRFSGVLRCRPRAMSGSD